MIVVQISLRVVCGGIAVVWSNVVVVLSRVTVACIGIIVLWNGLIIGSSLIVKSGVIV